MARNDDVKVALITGANQGIGFAIAQRLVVRKNSVLRVGCEFINCKSQDIIWQMRLILHDVGRLPPFAPR